VTERLENLFDLLQQLLDDLLQFLQKAPDFLLDPVAVGRTKRGPR
jgi:hypothetical protein